MALFGYLGKTLAEQKASGASKSPTARMLRKSGVEGQAALDFETVLTGVWEGVIRYLKTEANIELGPAEQKALRDILRSSLDPTKAASLQEGKRKEERLAELRQLMQNELAGLRAPAPSGGGIDMAQIMLLMQQQQQAADARMLQMLQAFQPQHAPAVLLATTPPAAPVAPMASPPAPVAPATHAPATPPPSTDEVITFEASDV